jgi:hypothetical protein
MVKRKHKTVEEIISKVEDDKKLVVERLRASIKRIFPKASEIVRQKRITYTLNKRDFSAIRLTKQHVDLLFLQGSSLSSPKLKGQGTIGDPKHIEIHSLKNFDEAETTRLLKEEAGVISS